MRDSVFVPANNNSFFIALIELHTQVRRTNYFLDCVTSEMLRHLVSASHRSGVRPELAVSPLMALSPPPFPLTRSTRSCRIERGKDFFPC